MLPFTDSLPDIENWLIKMAAFIAAILTFSGFLYKLYGWIKSLVTMGSKIQRILSQLESNGGESLRDAINRIESRQIKSEQKEKAVLHESAIAFFEIDTAGDIIWVNKAYKNMTGKVFSELEGREWLSTVSERDRERVHNLWNACVEKKRDFDIAYMMTNEATESQFQITCHAYLIKNPKEEISGWFGVIKKISGHFD